MTVLDSYIRTSRALSGLVSINTQSFDERHFDGRSMVYIRALYHNKSKLAGERSHLYGRSVEQIICASLFFQPTYSICYELRYPTTRARRQVSSMGRPVV